MSVTVDTNVLLRFFLNDDYDKALAAKKLFLGSEMLIVPDVVFPEIEYILKQHSALRIQIISAFQFIASLGRVQITSIARKAILIYEHTSFDMADCFIAATSFRGELASFDKKLLNTPGVTPYWNK